MMSLVLSHNEYRNLVNQPDSSGLNPLLYAVRYENLEILECLLNVNDLNLDYQDKVFYFTFWIIKFKKNKLFFYFLKDKNTALHYSVIQRKLKLIDLLIEKGADIDVQNADGKTSLMLAAQNGDEELIDYLLDYGADKNLKDKLGNTALNIAEASGSQKCVHLFKEHRPVKPNAAHMARAKRGTLEKGESNDGAPSASDSNKKFENLFAGSKQTNQDPSARYRMSGIDVESDTSKILSEEKRANKSEKSDSWGNSDEDEDSDQSEEEGNQNVSNLKQIIHEGDKRLESFFGKVDLTNSKEIGIFIWLNKNSRVFLYSKKDIFYLKDSNIEINFNDGKFVHNSFFFFLNYVNIKKIICLKIFEKYR